MPIAFVLKMRFSSKIWKFFLNRNPKWGKFLLAYLALVCWAVDNCWIENLQKEPWDLLVFDWLVWGKDTVAVPADKRIRLRNWANSTKEWVAASHSNGIVDDFGAFSAEEFWCSDCSNSNYCPVRVWSVYFLFEPLHFELFSFKNVGSVKWKIQLERNYEKNQLKSWNMGENQGIFFDPDKSKEIESNQEKEIFHEVFISHE